LSLASVRNIACRVEPEASDERVDQFIVYAGYGEVMHRFQTVELVLWQFLAIFSIGAITGWPAAVSGTYDGVTQARTRGCRTDLQVARSACLSGEVSARVWLCGCPR
jgi:hypothetical protein